MRLNARPTVLRAATLAARLARPAEMFAAGRAWRGAGFAEEVDAVVTQEERVGGGGTTELLVRSLVRARWWPPSRCDFRQVNFHPVRRPGRHAAPKEVVVFGPNRASQCERGCQDRPIVLVAAREALPCHSLETGVGLKLDGLDYVGERIEKPHEEIFLQVSA